MSAVSHHFYRRTARERCAKMNARSIELGSSKRYTVERRLGGLRWAVVRFRVRRPAPSVRTGQ